jgi:triosephosphate isomerase
LREFFRINFGKEISENQTIFYGGSVKLDNALEILKVKGNDGISSGRGAMNPEYFIDMIKISSEFAGNKFN